MPPYASANVLGARGYSPIFGGVPNLPGAGQTQGTVNSVINSAIPGFSGLTQTGTQLIDDLMNGKLPQGVVNDIQDAGAIQAAAGGMPGASRDFGSVFANEILRNVGTASQERKQRGFTNLLDMLRSYSGTAALTPGQVADQGNTKAMYDSAPIPSYAIPYMMDQYRSASMASSPASGSGGGNWADPLGVGGSWRLPGAAGGGRGSGSWIRTS